MLIAFASRRKGQEKLDDQSLGKLGVTFGVLRRLGFSEERVFECLKVIPTVELEDAFDWVNINGSFEGIEC